MQRRTLATSPTNESMRLTAALPLEASVVAADTTGCPSSSCTCLMRGEGAGEGRGQMQYVVGRSRCMGRVWPAVQISA